ncbi:MAG: hypothetical protein AB1481_06675 [Candidatus Omnitrophota bacterium]
MKKKGPFHYIIAAITLLIGLILVIKFTGKDILRLYLEAGVGNCKELPILCAVPQEIFAKDSLMVPALELLPYTLKKIKISLPPGFNAVEEDIRKVYYKKHKRLYDGAVVYVLYKDVDFFTGLFPELKKIGINDDAGFIERTMSADLHNTNSLADAFFVIMKGIFASDLGSQENLKMVKLYSPGRISYINFNISEKGNYFDSNLVDKREGFFKIYIKDTQSQLDLEKVILILSTVEKIS